ncbi:MAG TPA: hypothetical protein VEU06_08790 [Micropepsaceae bacterium]|nr:hypothetical protein [Micropepsaceae bacterium]
MRCFYHPERDAVGNCKHCYRGLCAACASEREGGLACRGRHEADVDATSALIARNIQVVSGSLWPMLLRVAVYWSVSAGLVYYATTQFISGLRFLFLALAAITFIAGLGSARLLTRPRAKKSD